MQGQNAEQYFSVKKYFDGPRVSKSRRRIIALETALDNATLATQYQRYSKAALHVDSVCIVSRSPLGSAKPLVYYTMLQAPLSKVSAHLPCCTVVFGEDGGEHASLHHIMIVSHDDTAANTVGNDAHRLQTVHPPPLCNQCHQHQQQ